MLIYVGLGVTAATFIAYHIYDHYCIMRDMDNDPESVQGILGPRHKQKTLVQKGLDRLDKITGW